MTSYLTRYQLIEIYPALPKSRPGLRYWIKRYGFPEPHHYLNCNHPVWSPDDVAAWFDARPTNHHDAIAEAQAAA